MLKATGLHDCTCTQAFCIAVKYRNIKFEKDNIYDVIKNLKIIYNRSNFLEKRLYFSQRARDDCTGLPQALCDLFKATNLT